jgi:hypothetical protein
MGVYVLLGTYRLNATPAQNSEDQATREEDSLNLRLFDHEMQKPCMHFFEHFNSDLPRVVNHVDPRDTHDGQQQREQSSGVKTIYIKLRQKKEGEKGNALIGGKEEEGKGSRRKKERKIGEVIMAVNKWRKLYDKYRSLDDAANKIGISKKSLDDYFL